MNCHAIRAVLDLHAEGRLTPRRAQAVAAHLASCAECRAQTATGPYGEGKSLLISHAVEKGPGDFKARLSAALKAERKDSKETATPKPGLALWPRDLAGVLVAAAALALIAVVIGWSGAPSQQFDRGDELAAGRMP